MRNKKNTTLLLFVSIDENLCRVISVERKKEMTSSGSINLDGLPNINWAELMSLPKKYWIEDMEETKHFFEQQVG